MRFGSGRKIGRKVFGSGCRTCGNIFDGGDKFIGFCLLRKVIRFFVSLPIGGVGNAFLFISIGDVDGLRVICFGNRDIVNSVFLNDEIHQRIIVGIFHSKDYLER